MWRKEQKTQLRNEIMTSVSKYSQSNFRNRFTNKFLIQPEENKKNTTNNHSKTKPKWDIVIQNWVHNVFFSSSLCVGNIVKIEVVTVLLSWKATIESNWPTRCVGQSMKIARGDIARKWWRDWISHFLMRLYSFFSSNNFLR